MAGAAVDSASALLMPHPTSRADAATHHLPPAQGGQACAAGVCCSGQVCGTACE